MKELAKKTYIDVIEAQRNYSEKKGVWKPNKGVTILLLHSVPNSEIEVFRNYVKWAMQFYKILSYSNAVECIAMGEYKEASLAITFDDGFFDNYKAAEVLSEFGISACFFVNSVVFEFTSDKEREKHYIEQLHREEIEFLDENMLRAMIDLGHEIGSHGHNHYDFGVLSLEEARSEIVTSKEKLEEICNCNVRHFAWPYGKIKNFSEQYEDLVYESGYESCASGVRGHHNISNRNTDELKVLYRTNVDGSLKYKKYFTSKRYKNNFFFWKL